MHANLIAYVTGSLDDAARAAFDAELRRDADLRRQVDAARRRLGPLLTAAVPETPPADLVVNTLAFVAEHGGKSVPAAPLESTTSRFGSARPWWRRVDVIVAASIIVTAIGVLLPGLLHLRAVDMQNQCANNLRQLGDGLNAYQMKRNALPDVALTPRPAAAMVIPMLRDAGVMPTQLAVYCPAAAGGVACLNVGVHELADMPPGEFEQAANRLLPGYAYSLGFRDDAGRVHGPSVKLPDIPAAMMPLLADSPSVPITAGNSANHAGRGQNVLFTDGHVAFKTQRNAAGLPGDDIYLNQVNKVAAGLGTRDVVLATGGATP